MKELKEKTDALKIRYERDIEKLLFIVNTNTVEYSPHVINDKLVGIRLMTPMVTPTYVSTKDLANTICDVPNRAQKADIINTILKHKIKDDNKDDIVIILDSSVYFGQDGFKIEHFIIENYKPNSYILNLLNDTGFASKDDLNNHVKEAISLSKQTGRKNIIIASEPIMDLDIFKTMDAILIDARGNKISISNNNIKILRKYEASIKANMYAKYTLVGTRDDLMRWSYKLKESLDMPLCISNGPSKDIISPIEAMGEFIMKIYKINDINIDDYGSMLIFNILLCDGYMRMGISDNRILSTKDTKYYDLDLIYTPFSKSFNKEEEKKETTKAGLEDEFEKMENYKPKKKPEGTKTCNTVFEKKENKVLGASPLEFIYTSLLDEYIKLTEENPKDYDARKSLIEMIKDTKSIL